MEQGIVFGGFEDVEYVVQLGFYIGGEVVGVGYDEVDGDEVVFGEIVGDECFV